MEHDHEPEPEDAAELERPAERAEPSTGEPRVDAALRQLRELDELPVSEHPQVFERVHGELVEVLGELHYGAGATEQADEQREQPGETGGA